MGWLKDVGKDSVVGVIVALATGSGGIALVVWLWKNIANFSKWIWAGLTYSITLPIWLSLIISLILLLLIPIVVIILEKHKNVDTTKDNSDPINDVLSYKQDTLFGMNLSWEWVKDYFDGKYYFKSIVKRCPNCHAVLEQNSYSYPEIYCITEGCNWKFNERNGPVHLHQIDNGIAKEIERRAHLIQIGKPLNKDKTI